MEEVNMAVPSLNPFNTPLETGIRAIAILVASFPKSLDLQYLVVLDHLVVHTGDLGGPDSLHPKLQSRSGELLVRRGVIERGLLLMISRGLVERIVSQNGFEYRAGDFAETFLNSLNSSYLNELQERSNWVVGKFGELSQTELQRSTNDVFNRWLNEFQAIQTPIGRGI